MLQKPTIYLDATGELDILCFDTRELAIQAAQLRQKLSLLLRKELHR